MSTGAGRRKGKYSQAARVIRLLEHLRSRRYGANYGQLAAEVDVTERQIRRDLDALDEAGFAIDTTIVDGRTGVRLVDPSSTGIRLSIRERFTLLATRRVFDVMKDTPLYEDVRTIYAKIAASLPKNQQDDLQDFGARFLYVPDGGTKLYRGKEDVFDALLTSVIRRWRLDYKYRATTKRARTGTLEPYALVLYKNGLYVIGSRLDGDTLAEPHVYAVERFTRAEHIRGSTFTVPADFDVERFFEGAFGLHHGGESQHVVVDFDERARPFVKSRRWHDSQKLSASPQGGLRLEFDVPDLTQVTTWVLGWGPLAKAVAPQALVKKVAAETKAAAKLYRKRS